MEQVITKRVAELDTYRKRVQILVGARFRDIGSISSAITIQDRLRQKIGSWKGAEEIRKWRAKR